MTKEKKTAPEASKAEQQTPATPDKSEEVKSHLLATGLEDYGFWWQQMAKDKAHQTESEKPFRRSRIWA